MAVLAAFVISAPALAQAVKVHEGNVVAPDGTVSLPSISRKGDANTGFYYPGADIVGITTGGTERARVDASGRMLINGQTAYGRLQQLFEQNSLQNGGAAFNSWSSSASNQVVFDFNRSKSGTIGTQTLVATGDPIAFIIARGSDGAAFQDAASIQFKIDGTPSTSPSGDMPGLMSFLTTADGGTGMTERMRIDNAGRIGVGVTPVTGFTAQIKPTTDIPQLYLVQTNANDGYSLFTSSADGALQFARVTSGSPTTRVTFRANGIIDAPAQVAFGVWKSTNDQTGLANNATVQITSYTEDYDTQNAFASNAFTAPVAGKYQINGCVNIEPVGGSMTQGTLILFKNGSQHKFLGTIAGITLVAGGAVLRICGSTLTDLAASDTLDIRANATISAGTWKININSTDTWFNGFKAM